MGDPEKAFSEKERISAEVLRDGPATPTMPVLPTVNPEIEKKEAQASALHPAVYVMWVPLVWQWRQHTHTSTIYTLETDSFVRRVWISLSSSIILFNKWILDTAKFRECHAKVYCHLTPLMSSLQIIVCSPSYTILPSANPPFSLQSHNSHMLAPYLCHFYDPGHGTQYKPSRWPQDC